MTNLPGTDVALLSTVLKVLYLLNNVSRFNLSFATDKIKQSKSVLGYEPIIKTDLLTAVKIQLCSLTHSVPFALWKANASTWQ